MPFLEALLYLALSFSILSIVTIQVCDVLERRAKDKEKK